ncbi:uncharacterized protein BDR25DRAFT_316526 [Lindgomyces ingoldianus]|uniref:Uncharacterized protein n=1 Tax=Lindgomyces ingoldianus TaxID=673940 RepID=A0ACB6QLY4_9PLEO|nr:uncharacterized protein BDR25DRAFT_316526 [Lindgomyces ingoldianus]KAF2467910.1 hypothetical protein BDR25DRAFT_316526 [Lindgomyces ingoldianus]
MSFALIPTPLCGSEEKLEKFLSLISDIADTTYANEPRNVSYSWFRKSPLDQQDEHRCCGFEVYADELALTQAHRSSPEYKRMRSVGVEEQLFVHPTALIFLEPACANGFLAREVADVQFKHSQTNSNLIVVRRYITKHYEETKVLLEELNLLARKCREMEHVLTFMPLKRKDGVATEVSVLERYTSQEKYEQTQISLEELRYDEDIGQGEISRLTSRSGLELKVSQNKWTHHTGRMGSGTFDLRVSLKRLEALAELYQQ